jgi:hypothetical protein
MNPTSTVEEESSPSQNTQHEQKQKKPYGKLFYQKLGLPFFIVFFYF